MLLPTWTLAGLPALGMAIGLLVGPAVWRRALALAMAVALLALPFLIDGPGLVRGIAALFTALTMFRTIDLLRDRRPRAARQRAWHVVSLADSRTTVRRPPRFAARLGVLALAWAVPTTAGLWLATRTPPLASAVWLRWLGGVVFAYCSFEMLVTIIELLYGACGIEVPRMHDAPIRSRSIAEFWGRRWNRVVGAWLRANTFLPVARRFGAQAGELTAFVASALLHFYVAWAALDLHRALTAGAFFAAQVPLLRAERWLGVARWPSLLGRAWTIGWLLLLSPLFVGPVTAVFDPLLR